MAISVDDREQVRVLWDKVVNRQFTVLSDPGARVIRSYGLVHPSGGMYGGDVALDTTVLVEVDGRERWRHVSETLPDLPTAEETMKHIRETTALPAAPKGEHKRGGK